MRNDLVPWRIYVGSAPKRVDVISEGPHLWFVIGRGRFAGDMSTSKPASIL